MGESFRLTDEVRFDTEQDRLVLLRFCVLDSETEAPIYWVVEDILSGESYELPPGYMGEVTFNEMEVLAWVASRS